MLNNLIYVEMKVLGFVWLRFFSSSFLFFSPFMATCFPKIVISIWEPIFRRYQFQVFPSELQNILFTSLLKQNQGCPNFAEMLSMWENYRIE